MQKDNTSATFFARNTIVNTDQNFAESGSFWYQLLKGKTKAAAKTMSKLPMLTNMASEVNNVMQNLTNNPRNIYLVNKEYNFKLNDLQLYFTVQGQYREWCKADKNSLKNFIVPENTDAYANGRIFLVIPLKGSGNIDFLNSDILCIYTFTKNNTAKSVMYPYVDYTQKDDALYISLDYIGYNLKELFDLDAQGKSNFIDAVYNLVAKDAVTGGFIFNAKYFGPNKINKSVYNGILSLHSVTIGESAVQSAEYIKGSNQTIENFGKTLNAMYRGIAVDAMCTKTTNEVAPDSADYEHKLDNITLLVGPSYNQVLTNIISRGYPRWESGKVFYPGDYYVSPIRLHYNNGKDLWWDPLKKHDSAKTVWTTSNSPIDKTYGLMYSEIANYGHANTDLVDIITYDNHPLSNGQFELNKPSANFSLRWSDEKLKTILNYYNADNQLGWFFKYVVPHAIIVDINIDILKPLYPDLNVNSTTSLPTNDFINLLLGIKKDAINLCPIGNLLIFRVSHYRNTFVPYAWRELNCYLSYGEQNFSN